MSLARLFCFIFVLLLAKILFLSRAYGRHLPTDKILSLYLVRVGGDNKRDALILSQIRRPTLP